MFVCNRLSSAGSLSFCVFSLQLLDLEKQVMQGSGLAAGTRGGFWAGLIYDAKSDSALYCDLLS